MSNYTGKAQLIGGGDIVYLARAVVQSYQEVQHEYSPDILSTTLKFRFSNSITQAQEVREIVIDSVSITDILRDMTEIYEIPADSSSPRFLDTRIDDSRILITLIHDSYDTLEILAQEIPTSDAITYLHLHPTPHPAGFSRVGQVRMSTSNKQNRALNAGAFLVRGEDRTSTGINRVLSKLSDNVDLVERRTRRSRRGDVQRVYPCRVAEGVVSSINVTLVGGEVLTTSIEGYKELDAGFTDAAYLQVLFEMAKDATDPVLVDNLSYDFIIGEEDTSSQYVFGTTAGRTSPSLRFDYSFIALSEAGRDAALASLSVPGSVYNRAEIDADPDYYAAADQLGTIHGPRYLTRTVNGDYVPAEVIDFFTLRFADRLPSLTFVNQGDLVIVPSGVFEVDFVGDDNRTIGVRHFGGSFGEVFSLNSETASFVSEVQVPTTLTPNEDIAEVILVKSGIGVRGEYYGVGRYGHDYAPISSSRRFRIRTLARDISTTAGDDTALRKTVHDLQGALDPYSNTSSYSIVTSLRAINAVGGVLKLPKLYSVPEDTQELYKLDYLIGSHAYGPLRVSPSQYAAVPSKLSIFSGIGGWRNSPDTSALTRTREAYYVAEHSISSDAARQTLISNIDAALLEGDWEAAKLIEFFLNEFPAVTVTGKVLPTALRQDSREAREDVVDFFREVMQIGGRSYVYNGTPAELDGANGLTVRLPGKAFFSEADVGRLFIIDIPMIAKEVQDRPQTTGLILPHPAYSKTRQVRVRMHTWTSPKSARFMPIDGMEFHLHREFSVTISPSLGYANIGYGAFTNSIIPTEHRIRATSSVDSKLTEGTEYRHIYPGNISCLDVDTPFTTSLRTYSHIYYVLGSEEQGAYLPDGAPAGADQAIDIFAEERSLLLLSESLVTFVGEQNSFSGAHPQDGQLELNHSNRVRYEPLSQLTFLPFLRSSDRRLRVRSDDFLYYLFQGVFSRSNPVTTASYGDQVAFSPNVYLDGITVTSSVVTQTALCQAMASLRGADLTNEYTQIPTDGSTFLPLLPLDTLPYISREVNGQLETYTNYDDFIISSYGDDVVLEIERAAGGVRPEDASLLKDIYNHNPTAGTQFPLNCEDLLIHGTLASKASLGHVRNLLNEDVCSGTRLTSNRILLTVPAEQYPESIAVADAIENAYGSASTDTGTLVQYVGLETIDVTHPFSAPFTLEIDNAGVGRLTIEETLGTARKVPRKTRSWFKLITTRADGTAAGAETFTFDNFGRVRRLSEYAQSGDATSSIYGAFQNINPISGQPTWEGVTWDVISSAPADVTSISSVEVSSALVDTFAIHSVLKSADIPYYVTAHVKSAAMLAPVSKELGKTLSSAITEQSGITNASFQTYDLSSPDAALVRDAESTRLLVSNSYPSIIRTKSGRVEKVTFDSAHSSGMDINIYDGNSLTSYSRDDGVRMSSFTRGYTDTLPNTPRASRKRNTLHVLSEEMISGVRITHAGIENTMFLDTLLGVTEQLQLYTPLAHAGLIVDLGGERAWSADSRTKHGVSDPNRLTSPLSALRRTVPVNTEEGSISIPLLAAAKINSNEAIGLYVDWEGEPLTYNPEDLPLTVVDGGGSQPVIHLTTSVDNASILTRGEQDIAKSLNSSGVPLLDRDNARSALTALGPISAIGTLRIVGDLRCTFYADENIGDGYAVLAGARGHLNPITAPRAQNYWNSLHSMAEHVIVVTDSAETVRALAQGTSDIFPNPLYDVNHVVAGDEHFRSNRNPEGKSQQQLGERHNIIKYRYRSFYPHDDTYLVVQQNSTLLSSLYTEEGVVQELEPTLCTVGGGTSLAQPTEVLYRPLAIGLYQPSSIPNDVLNGYKDEYLLFVMPRGIMSFGKAYLGRTVTLELNRVIEDSISEITSTVTIPLVISAVISDIEDRPDLSVTFVKLVATLNRFDTFSFTPSGLSGGPLITSGPQDLFTQIQPLYDAGLITSLNKVHLPPNVISEFGAGFDHTWGNLWSIAKNSMSYGAFYYAFQSQTALPPGPTLGQLQINVTVHGREWVLNAYQAYISDKLRLLNDLGGEAALYLKRNNTLAITSDQIEVSSPSGVTITSGGDVGIVSTAGDIAIASDEEVTITTASGAIILPDRTIPFNGLAAQTGYLSVTIDSYYVSSAAADWYDTLPFGVNAAYARHPQDVSPNSFPVEEKFVFKSNSNVVSFIRIEKSDPNMPDFEAYFNLGAIPMDRTSFDNAFAGANYIQNTTAWRAMCSSIAIVGPPGSVRESYRFFHPSVQMLSDDEDGTSNDTWGLNNRHISVERILENESRYSPQPSFSDMEIAYRLDDQEPAPIITNRANHKYRVNLPDLGTGENRTPTDHVVFYNADDVAEIRTPTHGDYVAPTFTVNRRRIRYTLSFAVQYGGWESYERRQFSGIYHRSNRVRGYPTITNFGINTFLGEEEWP